MKIETQRTNGCDKTSRVYGDMFNVLQDVMEDENKLKELSPLDYSALGMYIGKFVEQEINSSVVQIMRAFRGIDMPEYYCKRYPGFDVNADVEGRNRKIRLNEQKIQRDPYSLKSIPLGDAYYALEQLKDEDHKSFFRKYPWLYDKIFLEAWRNLFVFRNKMAHIGEIIDTNTLKKNYEYFQQFLKYMPDILEAKEELAPDDYIESLPQPKNEQENLPPYIHTENPPSDRPFAPQEVAKLCVELLKASDNNKCELSSETFDLLNSYNWDAVIF